MIAALFARATKVIRSCFAGSRTRALLREYLGPRPDLLPDEWYIVMQAQKDVATFAYQFFELQGIPIGSVRSDDRIYEDLHTRGGSRTCG